jgi:DNA-damage-inducible protein D
MKTDLIHTLTDTFEAHAQQTDGGIGFWLARDLQHLLGYTEWRNFIAVVSKAKVASEISGHSPLDHFVDVNKTIAMPKGAEKEVPDIMLTRYACYLIAQNGDPKKQEIAFAQTYFAVQTRKAEALLSPAGRRFDRMNRIYRMGLTDADYATKHPVHPANPVSIDFQAV